MRTIRIGGVPEHFNLPIHLAIESGKFEDLGIDIKWTTFHGGTGQMSQALRNDEVDLCILLTEGIITDILNGNPSKILSVYVNSPLCWGVHTGYNNNLVHYNGIFDKKYAISRFGSGSHLMSIVDANTQNISLNNSQFHIVNNLEGALKSLENLETDVFYWEKFTTKPYVDEGRIRRIGEYWTPWPCFVVAGTNKILESNAEDVIRVLRVIHDATDRFMQNQDMIYLVAERYNLRIQDAESWFNSTEWAIHGWVSQKMIEKIIFNINLAKIVEVPLPIPDIVWDRGVE